jgi:putative ABC transport system substrate-binding protein
VLRLAALICGLSAASVAAAELPRVVVVKSADRAAYAQVLAGFSSELRARVEEIDLDERAEADPRTIVRSLQPLLSPRPRLVLAIGPTAASSVRKVVPDVPVIFAMVPYWQRYGLEAPNVTGIALTTDFPTQLDALKGAFPGVKRVGMLYDPRLSAQVAAEAKAAGEQLGLSMVALEADAARAEKAVAGARGRVDAMLMLADKTVATAQVVRQLISFCESEKLPLLALSASQVKEGATLSLSASPIALGAQAGRLAARILQEKVDAGTLPVAQPEVLELSVNLTAAQRLTGSCNGSLELFRYAARKGYPVKVFE